MASKDEYYQRIIASLQADIKSQNSAISNLKSTVERQQKEIEALKASQGVPQQSSEPNLLRLNVEKLLVEVKRVCDQAILTNYEHLPTMFADRQEFEHFCQSSEQKFLSVSTISDYKKLLEARLKSIEDRLGRGFCLLAINLYSQKSGTGYRSILNGLKNLKDIEIEGCLPLAALLLIAFFAVLLLSSIKW